MNQIFDKNILLTAVSQKKVKLVRLLLEGGSDPNYRGYDGKTALMIIFCLLNQQDEEDIIAYLVNLLLESGANPNLQDLNGRTAIMHAFRYSSSPEIIHLLLNKGADPNITDNKGLCALSYLKERPSYMNDKKLGEILSQQTRIEPNTTNKLFTVPSITIDNSTPSPYSDDKSDQFEFPDTEMQNNVRQRTNTGTSSRFIRPSMLGRRHSEQALSKSMGMLCKSSDNVCVFLEEGRERANTSSILSEKKLYVNSIPKSRSDGDMKWSIPKSNSEGDFKNSSEFLIRRNTVDCSVSAVDMRILKNGKVNPPIKLPPITK